MFRKMRRFKQEMSEEECRKLLAEERRGVLSMIGTEGYPYGVPINYLYDDGKIYFHCAREGHKNDALKTDDRVCFTVFNHGRLIEGKLGLNVKSVVAFGRVKPVEDHTLAMEKLRKLSLKYNPEDYTEKEIARNEWKVQMLEMTIDHMTGKNVNES